MIEETGEDINRSPSVIDQRNIGVKSIVKYIFRSIPDAQIYGEYVSHYLNKETHLCKNIDVLVNDYKSLNPFINLLKNENIRSLKIREFSIGNTDGKEYRASIKLKKDHGKYKISFCDFYYRDVNFHAYLLKIDRKGNISPLERFSNYEFERIIKQNEKKELMLDRPLYHIESSYLRRYNYTKLISEASRAIKNGWKVSSKYGFSCDIYQGSINPKGTTICSICHEKHLNNFKSISLKECGHLFHIKCIRKHLEQVGPHCNSCPMCRKSIVS